MFLTECSSRYLYPRYDFARLFNWHSMHHQPHSLELVGMVDFSNTRFGNDVQAIVGNNLGHMFAK